MEIVMIFLVLFALGIFAYILLATFFSATFFVALGLAFLLCFVACVGFIEAGKQPIEKVEKNESDKGV